MPTIKQIAKLAQKKIDNSEKIIYLKRPALFYCRRTLLHLLTHSRRLEKAFCTCYIQSRKTKRKVGIGAVIAGRGRGIGAKDDDSKIEKDSSYLFPLGGNPVYTNITVSMKTLRLFLLQSMLANRR
jgi:hypothetical protein